MPLKDLEKYKIGGPYQRWNDELGTQEWTLTYRIPDDQVIDLRSHYAVSLDNTLPGHDTSDQYAPCVHAVYPKPSDAFPHHHEVTCIIRRPTPKMVLQPGRGIAETSTYATSRKRTELEITAQVLSDQPEADWSGIYRAKIATTVEVIERGVLVITTVHNASDEAEIQKKADSWLGKGNGKQTMIEMTSAEIVEEYQQSGTLKSHWPVELTKPRYKTTTYNLTINGVDYPYTKLAYYDIRRRPDDVSLIEVTWKIAKKDSPWSEDVQTYGDTEAYSDHGELIDDISEIKRVRASMFGTGRGWIKYENGESEYGWLFRPKIYDADTIKGYADFREIEDYLDWMS